MNGDVQNILPDKAAESGESTPPVCPLLPLVSALHDGELDESRSHEVNEHLKTCSTCSASMKDFQKMSAAFAAAVVPALTEENRRDLESIADDGGSADAAPIAGRIGADVRWVRRLTAIAAALFIFAMGRIVYQHTRPQTPESIMPTPANLNVPTTTGTVGGTPVDVSHPPHASDSVD